MYRVIIYVDFDEGASGGSGCDDLQFRAFESWGSQVEYNCDDVGVKDSNRKNGYMQTIFNVTQPNSYIEISSFNKCAEDVVSVELISGN